MDFEKQLLITIVDKALIGGLLALAALLGNRYLEQFKARQTIITEFTKERVSKISAVWEQLNLVCSQALNKHLLLGKELWEFIRRWAPDTTPGFPVYLEDTVKLVATLGSLKAPPGMEETFQEGLDKITKAETKRVKALISSINDLRLILEKERFWLQEDIYEKLALLILDITMMAGSNNLDQGEVVKLEQHLEKIRIARQNIGSVVDLALRSPLGSLA